MKTSLFQLSLSLSMFSNVVLNALTRSWWPFTGISPAMEKLVTVLLVALPAGIGIVLGVISRNRGEVKTGWTIVVLVLNAAMVLIALLMLFLD